MTYLSKIRAVRVSVFALAGAAMLTGVGAASASASDGGGVDLSCGSPVRAGVVSMGPLPDVTPQPLVVPIEAEIARKGVRNSDLARLRPMNEDIEGMTADYAMMRLSQAAGRPLWVVTPDGRPGPSVNGVNVADMSLEAAFDAIASSAGLRWKFDGEKVYLLNQREWTILLPTDRDLAIAVTAALREQAGSDVGIRGGVIHFAGSENRASQVSSIVADVFRQSRLDPFDVSWYRVWPSNGNIDWAGLAERTEAVRDIGFAGRGVSMVIDGDAAPIMEMFMSREGFVRPLGTATMVAHATGVDVSRVVGCGANMDPARGITLAAKSDGMAVGQSEVQFALTGEADDTSGSTLVSGDETLVIASGVPVEGSFLVALVRPRSVDLGNPNGIERVEPDSAAMVARAY